MMRSLFSGISGLRNHQTRMDVIGNNIANVNTAGYKTARVIFQDIFSQNIADGMANQQTIGGTNPMQVGLGIRLSTVDIIHSRATFQRTDKETDMMINGDGFFIVGQQNPETGQYETFYTRAGNFDLDNEGFLVTSNGFYVMGRTYELRMGVVSAGNEEIRARDRILPGTYTVANPPMTTDFRVGDQIPWGTFQGQPTADATYPDIPAPDRPAYYTVRAQDLVPMDAVTNPAPGGWLYRAPVGGPPPVAPPVLFETPAAGDPPIVWPPAGMTVPRQVYVPPRAPVFGLVAGEEYEAGDENGLNRIRATTERTRLPVDPETRLPMGYPDRMAGEEDAAYITRLEAWVAEQEALFGTEEVGLPGLGVADNGDISVIVGNLKLVIGRVAIAMFANPAGLEAAGNSLYRQTASSGQVVITEAYADGAGKIEGGGLEMSNVDLANEFTDMIVTQRGFQANSRIISVTDSMLEELVNLKR